MAEEIIIKKKKKKKNEHYYVDPKEFKAAIALYYENGIFPDYLGECIMKIANGLGFNGKFRDYTYKEDMIGDAIVKMYAALRNQNFDVTSKFNPFSYFTTIAFRAFINRIKKEKRLHKAETDFREEVYEQYMIESSDGKVYTKTSTALEEDDFFNE